MKKTLVITALLATIAMTACWGNVTVKSNADANAEGRTEETTVTYNVSSTYSKIEISSAVQVKYSTEATRLTVQAPEFCQDYIHIEESHGTLKIYVKNFHSTRKSYWHVTVPASSRLESINVNGASSFRADKPIVAEDLDIVLSGASNAKFDCVVEDDLKANVSGASDLKIGGVAEDFDAQVSGASDIKAGDNGRLVVLNLDLNVSGASSVTVECTGEAEGHASGASTVNIYGDCKSRVGTSGASSVRFR